MNRKFFWVILSLLTCLGFAIGFYFIWKSFEEPGSMVKVKPDIKKSINFELRAENVFVKKKFVFSSLRGEPILLHFWATWCAPCVNELPELISLAPTLKKMGYQIVAVAEDNSWKTLEIFFRNNPKLAKLKLNTQLLLDDKNEVASIFGSRQFPETYLINHALQIEHVFIGAQTWSHPEMLAYLTKNVEKN